MAKTLLNKDSRAILLNFAKAKIAETHTAEKSVYEQARQTYFESFEPIKVFVKEFVSNLYPKKDIEVLSKYSLKDRESCFWFKEDASAEREVYVSMPPRGCNETGHRPYYGGRQDKSVGAPKDSDAHVTLFHDELVADGIDVSNYLSYHNNNGKNTEGKRMSYSDHNNIRNKIVQKGTDLFYDNVSFDGMEFDVAYSKYSCHSRARLVTTNQIDTLMHNVECFDRVQIAYDQMQTSRRSLVDAYKGLIMGSRHFETILETWPEATEMSTQIGRKGQTAISIVSQDAIDLIKQDQMKRKAQDMVGVVATGVASVHN
jgi:hypothetical protein